MNVPLLRGHCCALIVLESSRRPCRHSRALGADGKPGTPHRICEDCGVPTDVSRDGSLLLMEDPVVQSPMLLNPRTGTKHPLTTVPERWHAYAAHFSHDGKWASFHADLGSSPFFRQILIVKLRDDDQTIPMQDWITVTDGKNMDREAYWSPTDDTLYFLSEREGFRCIWAQRLDPATKRPRGPALPVQHFHRVSRSLSNIPGTVAAVGLTAIPGQLIFGLGEVSGNIWMQKDEAR
jgi:hypothetical protein